MNPTTEFDRVLAEWLVDGPNRAPEHIVDLALAHAHRHPRRRDLLAGLRTDVMPSRRQTLAPRPGLVFAVLAVALAAVAVAVVGSRAPNDRVIPPGPTQPTTAPSIGPTILPSAEPSASATPARPSFHVDRLQSDAGNVASLTIFDNSGLVVGAGSAPPPTGDPAAEITATNVEPAIVRLTWLGTPCDTVHVLEIDGSGNLVLSRPRCFGDTLPRFLAVDLAFSEPVDATTLSPRIEAGTGANGLPNATYDGLDSDGNRFSASIFVTPAAIATVELDVARPGATVSQGSIEQAGANSITVSWGRAPCVTRERIDISTTNDTVAVTGEGCVAPGGGLERRLTFEFSTPVTASDFALAVAPASPTPTPS